MKSSTAERLGWVAFWTMVALFALNIFAPHDMITGALVVTSCVYWYTAGHRDGAKSERRAAAYRWAATFTSRPTAKASEHRQRPAADKWEDRP